MNYILLNDTSSSNNPGCQGTVACLRMLLANRDLTCVRSYPVGFGEHRFRFHLATSGWRNLHLGLGLRDRLKRMLDPQPAIETSAHWKRSALSFNLAAWRKAADQLESDYRGFFEGANLIVVNGEGTIHHNMPGALTLVAWIRAAARYGLPVWLVNCTIQSMDAALLDAIFESCSVVAVREPLTFADLKTRGYTALQASDALFAFLKPMPPSQPQPAPNVARCLYTPGVITADPNVQTSSIARHVESIIRQGWQVSYLTIETEDERFETAARNAGAKIHPLRRWTPENLINVLEEHQMVISGRYHVAIFAWLATRPVIPFASNSWKMEGLLQLAGAPDASVPAGFAANDWAKTDGFLPSSTTMTRLRELAANNAPQPTPALTRSSR